jgi:hypothetical protein
MVCGTQKTTTSAQVAEYAHKKGISIAQANKDATDAGYQIQQITQPTGKPDWLTNVPRVNKIGKPLDEELSLRYGQPVYRDPPETGGH